MRSSSTCFTFFSFFVLVVYVHAGLYYDQQTCSGDVALLNSAFASAFTMIDRAMDCIGQPPPDGSADLWWFPDNEARDLAARIFGGAEQRDSREAISLTKRLNLVKANYQYLLTHFRPPNGVGTLIGDGVNTLKQTDLLIYCDMSRLQRHGTHWRNPGREKETPISGALYESCEEGKTLAFSAKLVGERQVIYLCTMEKTRRKPYKILPDRDPIWMQYQRTFGDMCKKFLKRGKFEADYYSANMLDSTILHEMTHCIVSVKDIDGQYTLLRTDDNGSKGGYHWKNVHDLKKHVQSRNNADSYVYYGLGAWMLRTKQVRIRNNGCLEGIQNYSPGIVGSQTVSVDGQWSGPAHKRAASGHNGSTKNDRYLRKSLNPLEIRQFVTSVSVTGPSSANRFRSWNTTNAWNSTPSLSISATPEVGWNSSDTSSGIHHSTGALKSLDSVAPSSRVAINTTGFGSNYLSITVSVSVTLLSAEISTGGLSKTSESAPGKTSPSSLLITSPLHPSPSSFSFQATYTNGFPSQIVGSSNSFDFSDISSSLIPPQPDSLRPTSGMTSTIDALLPASFFLQTPTTPPIVGEVLCPQFPACVRPTPSWLESIFTARELFIPEITDLSAVPTRRIKQKDDDDDTTAIVFAKIKLPTDKCDLLPKPKGGILGVVANVANKLVDTVMDAACNIEFPVVKGNLPKWLDLTKFPGLIGYSPPSGTKPPPGSPENSPNPEELKPSHESTLSPKSTSQKSSLYSSSCSVKTLTNCKGTNIISGTSTKAYVTDCSTTTACSGTGTVSIITSTIVPSDSGEVFVHPGSPPGFEEEQDCFLKVMESASIITEEGLAACFGGAVESDATLTITLGPSSTYASSTNRASASPYPNDTAGPVSSVMNTLGDTSLSSKAVDSSSNNPSSNNPSSSDNFSSSRTLGAEVSSSEAASLATPSPSSATPEVISFIPEKSLRKAPTPGPNQVPPVSLPWIISDVPPLTPPPLSPPPEPTPEPLPTPKCQPLQPPLYC